MIIQGKVLAQGADTSVITDHIAGFHTVFNVTNTILFLPFVSLLSRVAMMIVPSVKGDV